MLSSPPQSSPSQQPFPPPPKQQLHSRSPSARGTIVGGKTSSAAAPAADIVRTLQDEGSGSSFPVVSHGSRSSSRGGGGKESETTTSNPRLSAAAAASSRSRRDTASSSSTSITPRKPSISEGVDGAAAAPVSATPTTTTTTTTTTHDQHLLLQPPPNHRLQNPPPTRKHDLLADELPSQPAPAADPISREPSPSRFASFASPLVRQARSFSSASASSTTSTHNLLANMFKAAPPDHQPAPSTTTKKQGFFGSLLHPSRSPEAGRPLPQNTTDIIDEFAGLSFATVMKSFLQEPQSDGTPSDPAAAQKRTPEARLEDAVATATELLDRVYAAYLARTAAIRDAVGEADAQREDLEAQRVVASSLRAQLDRLATIEREARDEQNVRMEEQARRIQALEAEIRRRDAIEEARRNRCKRASAASDSGFESDVDSILSRSDHSQRTSIVVSPMEEEDEGADSGCQDCESCRHHSVTAAVGAETKNPTPLREAWSPESPSHTKTPTPSIKQGVWGFFKKNQQQQNSWYGNDINAVRMENRILREQVREMEKAIDGALEAVVGRGIGL